MIGLLFGLLLFPGIVSTRADSTVCMGVFSLYRPQSLSIQLTADAVVWADMDGQPHPWPLKQHSSLKIQRQGDKLAVTLYGANRHIKSIHTATQINLASATWTTTIDRHRLVRILRGGLCLRVVNDAIQTVLETDRESLVARAVASEMSGVTEPEALKALAVVTRTFIETNRFRHRSDGFDFCDTTHCFWYQGEDRLNRRDHFSSLVKAAVEQTSAETVFMNGIIQPTHFTGSCGGMTGTPELIWGNDRPSAADVHRMVVCHWCRGSKFDRWQRRLRKAAFLNAVSKLIGFTPSSRAEIISESEHHGFVLALRIKDGRREFRFSGETIRSLVGRQLGWNVLLSNVYQIEEQDGWLMFQGRGFGHNVGLCLRGAIAQAQAGHTHDRILRYYFPTAQLTSENRSGVTP